MALDSWDLDDAVPVSVTFRDADGDVADPDEVTLLVLEPGASPTDPDAWDTVDNTRVSEGVYSGVITADAPGVWTYRFEGVGAVKKSRSGSFYVRQRWEVGR